MGPTASRLADRRAKSPVRDSGAASASAQGSSLLTGKKTQRGEVRVDFDKCLEALEKFACNLTKVPLLRIYWYDGTSTGPSPEHVALAFKPRVKVRLGFVNSAGQQKGVSSKTGHHLTDRLGPSAPPPFEISNLKFEIPTLFPPPFRPIWPSPSLETWDLSLET